MVSGSHYEIIMSFYFFIIVIRIFISQDNKEHIVTKTYYNKWNVTY